MAIAAITLELTTDDPDEKPIQLPVTMRMVLQWEQQFKGRSFGMLNDEANIKISYLYEIGFVVAQRRGLGVPEGITFPEFCARYDIAPVNDGDDDDDTPTGAVA